jgi:hypothetical protein
MSLTDYFFWINVRREESLLSIKQSLAKMTDSIWELCHKLGKCGIVWWDIKPDNIVLSAKKNSDEWEKHRDFVEHSVRFVDFDPRFLVRVEGKDATILCQINFLLYVSSCTQKTYTHNFEYRKNFLNSYIREKKEFEIRQSIRELSILTQNLCTAAIKGTYPKEHVEPYLMVASYAKNEDYRKICWVLGLWGLTHAEADSKIATITVEKWMLMYTYWGDFQDFLEPAALLKQNTFDDVWKKELSTFEAKRLALKKSFGS